MNKSREALNFVSGRVDEPRPDKVSDPFYSFTKSFDLSIHLKLVIKLEEIWIIEVHGNKKSQHGRQKLKKKIMSIQEHAD